MHPVVEMRKVAKDYPVGSESMRVLKSIDLTIERGEFVAIMGPSGSGKSTLMNLLGTLDRVTEGDYVLDGRNTTGCDDAALAEIRNRKLGFVFQGFNLLARRSIIDNIALPLLYSGLKYDARTARAETYLDMVGLSSHRDYLPNQLSGGQQQRIAIARALATEPALILADEPTGNLDSKTSKDIMELFRSLNERGITIVLVTHEDDIARYSKRLVQVKDGVIIYDGEVY